MKNEDIFIMVVIHAPLNNEHAHVNVSHLKSFFCNHVICLSHIYVSGQRKRWNSRKHKIQYDICQMSMTFCLFTGIPILLPFLAAYGPVKKKGTECSADNTGIQHVVASPEDDVNGMDPCIWLKPSVRPVGIKMTCMTLNSKNW